MFKDEKDFKKIVERLEIDSKPRPAHREKLRRQMLSVFKETCERSLRAGAWQFLGKTIMKSKITKLAVAAVIIIAVLIAINYFGGSINVTSAAFAEVAEQLRNARTLTCTIITHTEIAYMPTMRMDVAFKEPGYMRFSGAVGIVSIADATKKKGLLINPLRKEFTEMDLSNLPAEQSQINVIEQLRTLPDRADEVLGEKEMNGRIVQGFRVTEDGLDKTVWVDTETWELVRMEIEFANAPGVHGVVTDFKFNVELDDELFSLTPPEGYTRQKTLEMGEITEQNLVELLRFWVTYIKDGVFPPTLDPVGLSKAVMEMAKAGKLSGEPEPEMEWQEMMQHTRKITYGMMFVMQMQPENDWHYAGKDVTFGDANTPIFWYRPEGSETYRVIYGDLSVEDVAPEDVPK